MWKRNEEETPAAEPRAAALAPPNPASGTGRPARAAVLGRSLTFEGRLSGEEDLVLEGRFSGEISIPGHQVTIGAEGRVEAEIVASAIVVEGEIYGNLSAEQQVVVRASGKVHGDIRAPRVALDQGCRFKGTIDMEPGRREGASRVGPAKAEGVARPESATPQAGQQAEQQATPPTGQQAGPPAEPQGALAAGQKAEPPKGGQPVRAAGR